MGLFQLFQILTFRADISALYLYAGNVFIIQHSHPADCVAALAVDIIHLLARRQVFIHMVGDLAAPIADGTNFSVCHNDYLLALS